MLVSRFLSLCWDVFVKDVCKELGFVTTNAQAYAKKGSDHHKMWGILEICYIALTDDIIIQFLKYCKEKDLEVTCDNYWLFSVQLKNPNFVFMQQMVLTILHAMMLFRKGIRANKQEHISAGKNKLSLLFFGRNHPHYHYLISQEKKAEALMPPEIRTLKFPSLVLSRTQRVGHYQSGDAIIEEIK